MMGKVTVQTIAREANVSMGTVDRALNNRGRIKEETRQQILEIANRLGYQPNKIASALGRQHKFRIAAITPHNPYYFHQHIFRGLDEAIREVADFGVTVDVIPCESHTVSDGIRAMESLNRSLYDGVVLNPGGDGLIPWIDALADAGIPVVTFNSDVRGSKRSFFVGENAQRSGRMAGYMMGRLLGGHGTVAILTGFGHPGAHMTRSGGFLDALAEFPEIRVVANYSTEDSDETAYRMMGGILSEYPDLSGVFSNSATGSEACARFAWRHRGEYRPVMIGYDVTETVERCLEEGLFDMAIDQQPDRQSYNAIMLMYRHLAERWVPPCPELEIRANMVMRYNAREHSLARKRQDGIIL